MDRTIKLDGITYVVSDSEEIKKGDKAVWLEEATEDKPLDGAYVYTVDWVDQVHWNDVKIIEIIE